MNLIEDAWLPVIRADGQKDKIAPWQIAESNNPVIEIQAPRPDFQGALYQFLIGLLQTGFAPEDHDEWVEYWEEMPEVSVLKERFMALAPAFEVDNSNGPAFMQDFDYKETKKWEKWPIARILSDSPSKNAVELNKDLFVKRFCIKKLCEGCSAIALFTMQTNGQALGRSFRVGLRRGGPLTSIILSDKNLWRNLWLNVLPVDSSNFNIDNVLDHRIFPWLSNSRTSERNEKTLPIDCLAEQVFWGMPCRIRLDFKTESGHCDICGEKIEKIVEITRVKPYGIKYDGAWLHPLSPYFRKDNKSLPIPLEGKIGGLTYQDWLSLILGNESFKEREAAVVTDFMFFKSKKTGQDVNPRLWCFGYDLDKGKTRCWYENTLPFFQLDDNQRKNLIEWGRELIVSARKVSEVLADQVKNACLSKNKIREFKTPQQKAALKSYFTQVSQAFWKESESDFYRFIELLSRLPGEQRQAPPEIYAGWKTKLWSFAFKIFDEWALEEPAEDLDMKRIIAAREGLKKKLGSSKEMKALTANAKLEEETP